MLRRLTDLRRAAFGAPDDPPIVLARLEVRGPTTCTHHYRSSRHDKRQDRICPKIQNDRPSVGNPPVSTYPCSPGSEPTKRGSNCSIFGTLIVASGHTRRHAGSYRHAL